CAFTNGQGRGPRVGTMRPLASLVLALAVLLAAPAQAQQRVVVAAEEWVEIGGVRLVASPAIEADRASIAAYGPFRVLDEGTAALVGMTDHRSPDQFTAMMRDFP